MARHDWQCLVSIPITDAEAAVALKTGKVDRDVTLKDIEFMGMGCFTCQEPLTKQSFGAICLGEPEE